MDPRLKQVWELFLSYELEHLRIAGEMLKHHQGIEPEQLVGTTLPTPATFESNREYVGKVLLETSDLRLIEGGKWARVRELPSNWPSHPYQQAVLAGGAPSETVVRLRMAAAGNDLLRAADESLAQRASAIRLSALDGANAPNTAPERIDSGLAIEAEVLRLGDLATEVENFVVEASPNTPQRPRSSKKDRAA